jgi:hypothetical protein
MPKAIRKFKKMRKRFTGLGWRFDSILFLALTVFGTSLVVFAAYAWTAPSFAPPSGNVATPLNTGATSQTKSGALTVNGTLTAGGALTVSGTSTLGIVNSATQYRVAARSGTGSQTLSNGANTAVTFGVEDFDVGSFHSTSANTHNFTIPSGGDGVYLLIGTIVFDANSTGGRLVWWEKQAVGAISSWVGAGGSSGSYTGLTATAVVSLAGGDVVFLNSWQNSGGNLGIGDAAGDRRRQSEVQIIKLW